jgi:hypothetical protein
MNWRYAAVGVLALTSVACGGGEGVRAEQIVASSDTVVVYKTPTCGCCNAWVDHVREHGFPVVTHDLDDLTDIKRDLGVPAGRISCHTATVRGYTVEGHVPADLIRRMIDERAPIRGLTVPGMPMGSPGMEGLIKQDYDVLAFDSAGVVSVYAKR